ncbi:unnamed protein product [Rhizophagus irregularis]|nr:unnamed protein product [Rhizophagus irregularis]
MSRKTGGRPKHVLSAYVIVLGKAEAGDKDRQCVCKACAEVLKSDAKPMINRKERIKKHLASCEHFWTKYGEQAEEILGNCDLDDETPPAAKHIHDSTSISSFHTNSTISRRSSQSSITKYAVRELSKPEIPKFNDFLIRMTVSNGWAFQWINDPVTRAFFYWLNPKLKLPDRKQLAGPILEQAIENIENIRKEKLNQVHEQAGITLSFDGWKNIVNEELLGVMIILPSGETLVWKAVDISGKRGRAIDVIPHIEKMLSDLEEQLIKVMAVVTDSAAAYASARRQLRLKYPQYVFLPCFAHQCNLARYSKRTLFKYYAIIKPGDTRWNSYYNCYKSLIRTRQALRNLATRYEPPEISSFQNTELYLPINICQIIMDDSFWSQISKLATLMQPYCGALDKLQADKARLSDVALSFGYFIKFWEQNSDQFLAEGMILRLEKRWKDWEQPLLLLSLLLHPKYRLIKFNPDLELINFATMGTWLSYYYKAWTFKKPTKLLAQFESYQVKKPPFDDETFEQFDDDILAYWYYCSTTCNELGLIATNIFSICVNSASVERLFSSIGFLHTPRRNKLKHEKVVAMAQLRADIHQIENERKRKRDAEMSKVNIAPPINELGESEIINVESQDDIERMLEDSQDNYVTTVQDWKSRLEEWNELLIEEEQAQNLAEENRVYT